MPMFCLFTAEQCKYFFQRIDRQDQDPAILLAFANIEGNAVHRVCGKWLSRFREHSLSNERNIPWEDAKNALLDEAQENLFHIIQKVRAIEMTYDLQPGAGTGHGSHGRQAGVVM